MERLNRFACRVEINGQATKVYLPNSGRLEELLLPQTRVIIEKRRDQGKTHHDLLLVETSQYPDGKAIWAALDSRLPPRLLEWAIARGMVEGMPPESVQQTEPVVDSGRLDLKLTSGGLEHYIETKSVNLIDQHGMARFPDAPTKRGQRHLEQLIKLRRQGCQASLVFIIVRHDAVAMAPFVERDPAFSDALIQASKAGVNITALKFKSGFDFEFHGQLPVVTKPKPFPGYWPAYDP